MTLGMGAAALLIVVCSASTAGAQPKERPRAREIGVEVGIYDTGPNNAITDVAGVSVGHSTVIEGDSVRTGVTAILSHDGNLFDHRVPAAIFVANGFGKLVGSTQVAELGELETPVLLTCTLCVWRVADAVVAWMLDQPGMESVRSINPVVAETNDGRLNAIRSRPVTSKHVYEAIESASPGPVGEGSVGAGTGTVAFGWKGGIGTSSRILPELQGGLVVGVLVQSNCGGSLTINGAPVGRELGRAELKSADADGSVVIVVATDAPLTSRQLARLAKRALSGIVRTGASMSNSSGDYVIAFSTVAHERDAVLQSTPRLNDDVLTPLFEAVADASEEAVYNSLLRATQVSSRSGTAPALPVDEVVAILLDPSGRLT
jgi:D-aminopeptidase